MVGILNWIAELGCVICFVWVVIKMFQNGKTGLGIATILLTFLCGIGVLVAYVVGWMRVRDWNLMTVMAVWTGLFLLSAILTAIDPSQFQHQ